jgi:hypothetical protein
MSFRDLIASVSTLNDLTVIQEALVDLLNDRRAEILRQKLAAGQQVGMVAERGRGDRKTRTPVNGVVKEVKGGKAIIVISAPVKYSGTKCRAPFQLICDAFDLSKQKERTFAEEEEPDFEGEELA